MTVSSDNAKVLYNHYNLIGRPEKAEELLRRWPELKSKAKANVEIKPSEQLEAPDDGKKPKG